MSEDISSQCAKLVITHSLLLWVLYNQINTLLVASECCMGYKNCFLCLWTGSRVVVGYCCYGTKLCSFGWKLGDRFLRKGRKPQLSSCTFLIPVCTQKAAGMSFCQKSLQQQPVYFIFFPEATLAFGVAAFA